MKRLAAGVVVMAATVSALSGCGSEGRVTLDRVDLYVSAEFHATAADQIGFVYRVWFEQFPTLNEMTCPALAPSLVVTAGNEMLPLDLDQFNCWNTKFTTSPILQPSTFTVTAEQDGKMIAQATYDGLTPGVAASLASPADGMVHAGDEVVVAPPPALPSSMLFSGYIYPLEGDPWRPQFTPGFADRRPDGVHTQMPAFSGRAALVILGSPIDPDFVVSCVGFNSCLGLASSFLGPVFVTGTM